MKPKRNDPGQQRERRPKINGINDHSTARSCQTRQRFSSSLGLGNVFGHHTERNEWKGPRIAVILNRSFYFVMNKGVLIKCIIRIDADYATASLGQERGQRSIMRKEIASAADVEPGLSFLYQLGNQRFVILVRSEMAETIKKSRTPARLLRIAVFESE